MYLKYNNSPHHPCYSLLSQAVVTVWQQLSVLFPLVRPLKPALPGPECHSPGSLHLQPLADRREQGFHPSEPRHREPDCG